MGDHLTWGVGHGAGGQRPEWSSPWGTGSRALGREPPPFCPPASLGSGPSREEDGQAGAWPRFLGQRKGWWGGTGDF